MIGVAKGVQPVAVDATGQTGVIDIEPGSRREANRLESDVCGVGRPADGEKDSSTSIWSPLSRVTPTARRHQGAIVRSRSRRCERPLRLRWPATDIVTNKRFHPGEKARRAGQQITFDPRPFHAVAISTPTPPAPTTANRGGTALLSVAFRLVHGFASATPGMSGSAAVLPVQIATAWRAASTTSPSSAVATATRCGPSRRAWPRNKSTSIPSTAAAWPSSVQLVT